MLRQENVTYRTHIELNFLHASISFVDKTRIIIAYVITVLSIANRLVRMIVKEHRKEMEKKEQERDEAEIQRWKEEDEAERIANHAETGLFETNSEREYRESNAKKWQTHLEKKEQELRELDDKMIKHP